MRICIICDRLRLHGIGGLEIFVQTLSDLLANKGHEVHVICASLKATPRTMSGAHIHYASHPSVPNYAVNLIFFAFSSVFKFLQLNKAHRFDIVHLQNISLVPLVQRDNSNFVYSIHNSVLGSYLGEGKLYSPSFIEILWHFFRYSIENTLCRKARIIIAPSRRVEAILTRSYGVPSYKIVKIADAAVSEIATEGSCAIRKPQVLFVARLQSRYKNLDRLLYAMRKVRVALPPVKLIVVGDGRDRPRLERLAADLGLSDCVTFLGFVSNRKLEDLYDTSLAVVMPSQAEGISITIVESLAHGTPVICSPESGGYEVIRDGTEGFVVDCTNSDLIAEKIIDLATDSSRIGIMSKSARERARQFLWDEIVVRHLKIYESCKLI